MHQNFEFNPDDFRFSRDLQIRFNDIDILGHLNNTVYLSLFDTAKAHYFEAVKGGNMNWRRVETVIANVNCSFIDPVLYGEDIEVFTRCESLHEKSFILRQVMVEKTTGTVKAVCDTVMVSIDVENKKSTPVPEAFRKMLLDYEGRDLCEDIQ